MLLAASAHFKPLPDTREATYIGRGRLFCTQSSMYARTR